MMQADAIRLITLTFPDDARPLAERLDEAGEALKRWRRLQSTLAHVRGGFAVFEITRNTNQGTWHPHIHLVVEGSFWQQAAILAAWQQVVPGAKIVDVRAVHSREGAARYLAKYVAKGTSLSHWPAETIREYAHAIHRRRLAFAFGTWHRLKVDADEEKEAPTPGDAHIVSIPVLTAIVGEAPTPNREALHVLGRSNRLLRDLLWGWWSIEEKAAMNERVDVDEVEAAASRLSEAIAAGLLCILGGLVEPAPLRQPSRQAEDDALSWWPT